MCMRYFGNLHNILYNTYYLEQYVNKSESTSAHKHPRYIKHYVVYEARFQTQTEYSQNLWR